MSYPAISFTTATAGRHWRPQKRLQTPRQPPVYPNSSPDHRPCNSLTPLPLSSRRPSVDSGLGRIPERSSTRECTRLHHSRDSAETPEPQAPTLYCLDHEPKATNLRVEVNMKDDYNPDRPLTQDEMHWDRISLFLTAMGVGIFIVALLATGKSETGLPKAAGLMLASIGMVGTTMMTIMAIFVPRNAGNAETLRGKTRRVGWGLALLGLTVAGAAAAFAGHILAG